MYAMKVLRSAIIFVLLSFGIVTVISEEKNVPFAQDDSIGSLIDGSFNRDTKTNNQENLQSNEKSVKKRNDNGGGWLGSGGHGRMNMDFGGGRWMNRWRQGGIGMNFGGTRWMNGWKPGVMGMNFRGGGRPESWRFAKMNMGLGGSGRPGSGMSWGVVRAGGHGSSGYAMSLAVVGNKAVMASKTLRT